jgi:hypothetical protein
MPLEPHQSRVVSEKEDLDDKLEKLNTFIGESHVFPQLGSKDQELLLLQAQAMKEYSEILAKRIERFK